MAALAKPSPCMDRAALRAWLTYVIETSIDWLDALDAPAEDIEDIEADEDFEVIEMVRIPARRA